MHHGRWTIRLQIHVIPTTYTVLQSPQILKSTIWKTAFPKSAYQIEDRLICDQFALSDLIVQLTDIPSNNLWSGKKKLKIKISSLKISIQWHLSKEVLLFLSIQVFIVGNWNGMSNQWTTGSYVPPTRKDGRGGRQNNNLKNLSWRKLFKHC